MFLAKPCPRCSTVLEPHEDMKVRSFRCAACGGRWVERRDLESWADPGFLAKLDAVAALVAPAPAARCPGCRAGMDRLEVQLALGALPVCRCSACDAFWFELDGIRAVPLSERERERRRRQRTELDDAPELPLWMSLVTFAGLPIEAPSEIRLGRPLLTWSLAGALLLVMIVTRAGGEFEAVLQQWGFVPNETFRHLGSTWVTSFFLHAGWLHLLGNLYFLLVFGNDVEHELGRLRHAALLGGSSFLALLAHAAGDPSSRVPLVGASGGISGVLAFYALAFSRRKIYVSFWFLFVWFPTARFAPLGIPAIWLFLYWVLLQVLTAVLQEYGLSAVSGLGHLGGAAGGVAAWWAWQRRVI